MSRAVRLLLVVALLGLSGCGWHLRGQGGTSLDDVRLALTVQSGGPELRNPVVRALRGVGAKLVEPAAADAVLVLLGEGIEQRPVSVSADARVQEYELALSLRYRLDAPDGEALIPEEVVQVTEVYRYDGNNVLSAQSRAVTVTDRLRQDAARLLTPRIRAAFDRQD